MGSVVALAGQIGGAKLADGLRRARPGRLSVIVNTGDDYEYLGLAISPDVDTMLYTLGGVADPRRGWEPVEETFSFYDMLKRLGGADRIPLGDRGLATQLLRAEALRNELRLTEITRDFCHALGIDAQVLPMCDEPVRTQIITEAGAVRYHEYFSDLQCEPEVKEFFYAGADQASLSDEVKDALYAPDLEAIVICPSNPYHVIGPILAIQGMRELLRERGVPIIAMSPIVGGNALHGSAGKMMKELGHEVSARGVAMGYYRLIDGFIIDREDEALAEGIRASGFDVLTTQTFMRSVDDRLMLANAVLQFAAAVGRRKQRDKEDAA